MNDKPAKISKLIEALGEAVYIINITDWRRFHKRNNTIWIGPYVVYSLVWLTIGTKLTHAVEDEDNSRLWWRRVVDYEAGNLVHFPKTRTAARMLINVGLDGETIRNLNFGAIPSIEEQVKLHVGRLVTHVVHGETIQGAFGLNSPNPNDIMVAKSYLDIWKRFLERGGDELPSIWHVL